METIAKDVANLSSKSRTLVSILLTSDFVSPKSDMKSEKGRETMEGEGER